MSKEKKLHILRMIRESKHMLFGAFSSTITKQEKANEWKKILNMCKALELIKGDKDFSYIRDTFWPNIKKATLAKVDNSRKTGSGGGKTSIINEIDDLVLDIIGKESPTVVGLNQLDTMAIIPNPDQKQPDASHPADNQDISNNEDVDDPGFPSSIPASSNPVRPMTRKVKRWITKNSPQYQDHKEELRLKRRKLELEVEHLELSNYKLRLELFKEEDELGLERSKYTSSLISINN